MVLTPPPMEAFCAPTQMLRGTSVVSEDAVRDVCGFALGRAQEFIVSGLLIYSPIVMEIGFGGSRRA